MTPPSHVRDFVVAEELGRGWDGVVYRLVRGAEQYAIKMPLAEALTADPEAARTALMREAVNLARTNHPALPKVCEIGEVDSIPYVIMELVKGNTLSAHLARGVLDESAVVTLAVELTDALTRLHSVGLLHRDINLHNVLYDASRGTVALIDFGSSESGAEASSSDVAHGWKPGGGVPQVEARGFDETADLRALGRVLFDVAFGRHCSSEEHRVRELIAFEEQGKLPVSGGFAQVLKRLLGSERCFSNASELALELRRTWPQLKITNGRGEAMSTYGSRLLDRRQQLATLQGYWAQRHAHGGRIVLVKGVTGSGKSALIESFLRQLEPGVVVLRGRCEAWSYRPFDVVRQLLEGHVATLESLSVTHGARELEDLRTLAGNLSPLLRLLSPKLAEVFHANETRVDLSSEDPTHIFVEGVAEFLSQLLRSQHSTLVVIDDVQWMDAASYGVLKRAISNLHGVRAMVLLTARSEREHQAAVDRVLVGVPADQVSELSVGRLSADDVSALIREQLGEHDIAAEDLATLARLTDGIPLSVLETTRAVIDSGALTPHWGSWRLDHAILAKMNLPGATRDILGRRIAVLDPQVEQVLRVGAIVGSTFEEDTVRRVLGLTGPTLHSALSDAHRRLLIEGRAEGVHRFVHDSIREALLDRVSDQERRVLHQRCAEALDDLLAQTQASLAKDGTSKSEADDLFRLASHYANGLPESSPLRTFEVTFRAGQRAFEKFDNATALQYFFTAEAIAHLVPAREPAELDFFVAETLLRLGQLDTSLQRLVLALERTAEPVQRALILSRIAWIHESRVDSRPAWEALERAFAELGEELPTETVRSFMVSLSRWLGAVGKRPEVELAAGSRKRLETLCAMYYQAGRLGVDGGKPFRMVQATMRGLPLAGRLGASSAMVKTYLMASFVLAAVGWSSRSRRVLDAAQQISRQIGDPVTYAHTIQVKIVVSAWAGDIRDAIQSAAECLTAHSHWQELSEYCVTTFTQQAMEGLHGRSQVAWGWIQRALVRIDQQEGRPVVMGIVNLAARAALASVGRDAEAETTLRRITQLARPCPANSEYYAWTFGPRLRWFSERGDLGAGFEAVVREFDAKQYNPRKVHLFVAEYYVHLCHARIHALLTNEPAEWPRLLPELDKAVRDLKRAGRLPLVRAHHRVTNAYALWFRGEKRPAEREFDAAEKLARQEGNSWVLYAVCRGRAHMLRQAGEEVAARDQARMALVLAEEHGAAYRARFVREGFGLLQKSETATAATPDVVASQGEASEPDARRVKRHLQALLRVGRASLHELDPNFQARVVLDELIRALDAERGLLFLRLESSALSESLSTEQSRERLKLIAGRTAQGGDLTETVEHEKLALREALRRRSVVILDVAGIRALGGQPSYGTRSMICAPLVLREQLVGAVYLDSSLSNDAFGHEDGELLSALAGQIPVTLELAQALRDRERLSDDLRQAQKMEALGRLAGGIAHDFNNMLAAIRVSADSVMLEDALSDDLREDLRTIQGAADSAASLTNQLLAFSRQQMLEPTIVNLNQSITDILPMVRRLLGADVDIQCNLDHKLSPIRVDVAQMDQVLVNLAVNAKDAMPSGGTLTLTTHDRELSAEQTSGLRGIEPGRYVSLRVADTGRGMDAPTRARAFEPFFTTKDRGRGTGLGLAMVHAIVTQSGGYVAIESDLNRGTNFDILLPAADDIPVASQPVSSRPSSPDVRTTILVVDDEPLVLRSVAKALERVGHRVLTAEGPAQALALAQLHHGAFELLLTDVMLPGMNGLELCEKLREKYPGFKVLFMSGCLEGDVVRELEKRSHEFVRKPLSQETLLKRIRIALASSVELRLPDVGVGS